MAATPAEAGTVLVGTFNEPSEKDPVLTHGEGLVRTGGWPEAPEVLAGDGPDAPAWIARGRTGTASEGRLYAALHRAEGQVAVLTPTGAGTGPGPAAGAAPADGPQTPGNDVGWVTSQLVPTSGSDTCHVDLNPAGTWLAAASYTSGTLMLAPVLEDGLLGDPVVVAAPDGSGPVASRQGGPHLHFVLFLDDDRLLVTDLGTDRILEYSVAALTGTGTAAGAEDAEAGQPTAVHHLPAGTGPRHLALLPGLPDREVGTAGDQLLAVVGELDSRLHLLSLTAGPEGFTELAVVPTHGPDEDPDAVVDNYPSHLVPSPDGTLVYVANRGRDTIGVIRLSGTPELVAEVPCGGSWPRHIALGSPAGAGAGAHLLYVALERADAVVGLVLDAEGIPGDAGTRVTVWRPGFVLPV